MTHYRYDDNEPYWTAPRIFLFILAFLAGMVIVGTITCMFDLVGGAVTNGAQVVKKELYPDALLRKYEWFKDSSAALDEKQANISLYHTKIDALTSAYGTHSRAEWPRDDREQWAIWSSELAGVKASYNSLAAEYNSQMSKLNWRFTNVGDLPPGASTPLPREYKPYATQ